MSTLTVSSRNPCEANQSKIIPSPFSLGSASGNSYPQTHLQQCPSSRLSSSSPLGTKRPRAIAMTNSGDDYHPVNVKRTVHDRKRQKYGNAQVFGTDDLHEASCAANKDGTVFRHLQEQREQLPIARGGVIPAFTLQSQDFYPRFCRPRVSHA